MNSNASKFYSSFLLTLTNEIGWIAKGLVPEYKKFANVSKVKRDKRYENHVKEACETDTAKQNTEKKSGSFKKK